MLLAILILIAITTVVVVLKTKKPKSEKSNVDIQSVADITVTEEISVLEIPANQSEVAPDIVAETPKAKKKATTKKKTAKTKVTKKKTVE